MDHGDLVGDFVGRRDVVRDHDRRHREFIAKAQDELVDLVGHDRVERRGGFIVEHDFRFHDERARKPDAAAHAPRKLGGHFGLETLLEGRPFRALRRRSSGFSASVMSVCSRSGKCDVFPDVL